MLLWPKNQFKVFSFLETKPTELINNDKYQLLKNEQILLYCHVVKILEQPETSLQSFK